MALPTLPSNANLREIVEAVEQIQPHFAGLKTTLAANIAAKGTPATGGEKFDALIGKVKDIQTGMSYASGIIPKSTIQTASYTMNSLDFEPAIIIALPETEESALAWQGSLYISSTISELIPVSMHFETSIQSSTAITIIPGGFRINSIRMDKAGNRIKWLAFKK